MDRRRKNRGEAADEGDTVIDDSKRTRMSGDYSQYEQIRDLRIKENMEKMQKLGLLDLSLELKTEALVQKGNPKNPLEKKTTQKTLQPDKSPRRSSRIKSLAPISYFEGSTRTKQEREPSEEVEICIPEGSNPEVYTEEQEKLLGDCETAWELYVDGCDEDGNRIYDSVKGETCHQCRQKTLGQHTNCSRCELSQGQICGDCLYMRYGENVIEVNQNPKWSCPCCRGICNCSRCRKAKGWMPTGNIYRTVREKEKFQLRVGQKKHTNKGICERFERISCMPVAVMPLTIGSLPDFACGSLNNHFHGSISSVFLCNIIGDPVTMSEGLHYYITKHRYIQGNGVVLMDAHKDKPSFFKITRQGLSTEHLLSFILFSIDLMLAFRVSNTLSLHANKTRSKTEF